jgi:hypothetical protein
MTPQPVLESHPEPRKATGPTTPAGKDRSRLTALRHGLAGQTVLMPWEDQATYQTHCAEIIASLAPAGKLETDCAQSIANDRWRLNRAQAVDANMFALGQFDYEPATGDAQIDAALNTARAFRDHSKSFLNISLYEQRINRSLEKNLARLRELQNQRKMEEGMARAAAIRQKAMQEQTLRAAESGNAPRTAISHGREFVYASASTPPLAIVQDRSQTTAKAA